MTPIDMINTLLIAHLTEHKAEYQRLLKHWACLSDDLKQKFGPIHECQQKINTAVAALKWVETHSQKEQNAKR